MRKRYTPKEQSGAPECGGADGSASPTEASGGCAAVHEQGRKDMQRPSGPVRYRSSIHMPTVEASGLSGSVNVPSVRQSLSTIMRLLQISLEAT